MRLGERSIDLATVAGLVVGFALIAVAVASSGAPRAFLDWPSIMIVLGGTFAVTTISFSFAEIWRAQSVVMGALMRRAVEPADAARHALQLADRARRQGRLALQSPVAREGLNGFQRKAMQLAIDGMAADEMERILRQDAQAIVQRHAKSASVLRKAAEVAPAMGLIGTLVGLVQMLGNLDDPSAIGPGMALALLTTFYGAVLANMVFAPLAAKLERNSEEEALLNQIFLMAAGSIGRQENPRILETMLNGILPPQARVRLFD